MCMSISDIEKVSQEKKRPEGAYFTSSLSLEHLAAEVSLTRLGLVRVRAVIAR